MVFNYLKSYIFLIFHQIDAAYWHEWELFFLPGGIQGYLVFNMLIIPFLLIGYKNVIVESGNAAKYSFLCSGLGSLTFVIHILFLIFGYEQFKLPLSLIIIVMCLFSSVWQLKQTIDYLNKRKKVD